MAILFWITAVLQQDLPKGLTAPLVLLASLGITTISTAIQVVAVIKSGTGILTDCAKSLDEQSCEPRESLRLPLQATWWLCSIATIHWMGYVAVHAQGIATLLFALALTVAAVAFQFQLACSDMRCLARARRLHLPLQELVQHWNRNGDPGRSDLSTRSQDSSTEPHDSKSMCVQTENIDPSEQEADQLGRHLRCTNAGTDPEGNVYLAGWVRFCLVADQKSEQLSIGFCPALTGDLEIELECEPPEVAAATVNQTPSGMRVEVKRQHAEAELQAVLHWQCTELSPKFESANEPPMRRSGHATLP